MQSSAHREQLLHLSESPPLRVSATGPDDADGLHFLCFSGTMCTTTVPGAIDAITRWLARTAPIRVGVDLADVEFIDGRGVSLLVSLQLRTRALDIEWSIVDPGRRARDVLDVCELLGPMGIESSPHGAAHRRPPAPRLG